MCGEDDDGASRTEELLYTRFVASAQALLNRQRTSAIQQDVVLASIDKLFTDALSRAMKDTEAAADADQYAMLAMQPVVFARLAGFLAGHLSLQEDPLRKVMEAMMHGYAEAEQIDRSGHDHGEGWHTH